MVLVVGARVDARRSRDLRVVQGDTLFDLPIPEPRAPLAVVKPVDRRQRTADGRVVRHRRCVCCGAATRGGAQECSFCRVESCGGACGPLYFPGGLRPNVDLSGAEPA